MKFNFGNELIDLTKKSFIAVAANLVFSLQLPKKWAGTVVRFSMTSLHLKGLTIDVVRAQEESIPR